MTFGNGLDVLNAFPEQVKNKTFLISSPKPDELTASIAESLSHGEPSTLILLSNDNDNDPDPDPTTPTPTQKILNLNKAKPNKPPTIIPITTNYQHLPSLRAAIKKIKTLLEARNLHIDGIITTPDLDLLATTPCMVTTDDGVERQFQVNYLVNFLVVNSLVPVLGCRPGPGDGLGSGSGSGSGSELESKSCNGSGGRSRVVLVSAGVRPESMSSGYGDVNFGDGKNYDALDAFAQSMLANIQFVKSLAISCATRSVVAFSVSPGNTKANIQNRISQDEFDSWLRKKRDSGHHSPLLLQQAPRSLDQSTATALRALLDPILMGQSGSYLDNCQVLALPNLDFPNPSAKQSAERLWGVSEGLVGEEFRWL